MRRTYAGLAPSSCPVRSVVTVVSDETTSPTATYYWGGGDRPQVCAKIHPSQLVVVVYATAKGGPIAPDSVPEVILASKDPRSFLLETLPSLIASYRNCEARGEEWHILMLGDRTDEDTMAAVLLIEQVADTLGDYIHRSISPHLMREA